MTAIAALVTPQGCYMAGDSIAVDENGTTVITSEPKVGRFGNILIGYTGPFFVGQKAFDLARTMKNPTWEKIVPELPRKSDWTMLFVQRRRIFEIHGNGSWVQVPGSKGYSYAATGDAAAVLLGSLYRSHEDSDDLLWALEAACWHTNIARKPFWLAEL